MTSYKHVLTQIFYMSNLSHSFLVWLINPHFTAIDNMANATRSSVREVHDEKLVSFLQSSHSFEIRANQLNYIKNCMIFGGTAVNEAITVP